MNHFVLAYRRSFDFQGRSSRAEFWNFTLVYALLTVLSIVTIVLIAEAGGSAESPEAAERGSWPVFLAIIALGIFLATSIIPAFSLQVRRFHDIDRSGWFMLLNFVPYVGGVIVLVCMCLQGTSGWNRFGPDPKDPTSAEVFA